MSRHNCHGLVAYDVKTGDILHIHFSASDGDAAEAETHMRRLIAHHGADVAVLPIPTGSPSQGVRMRVDPATGALRATQPGETGFSAAAGIIRPIKA